MSEKDIIEQLTKEIDVLKLELVRLHRMLQQEADSSTKHIQELYKRVKETHDYTIEIDKRGTRDLKLNNHNISRLFDMVWPIEGKIFPEVSKARQQLASIIEQFAANSDDAQDKKQ
jgi:hypothetical protein